MTTVTIHAPGTTGRSTLPWITPVAGLVLGSAASILCLTTAGPLHGVLFGACVVAALLTPALVAGERRWGGALLTTAAILVGCIIGPLVAVLQGNLNGRLFSALVGVVAPLVVALGGLTALLVFVRLPAAIVTAIVTILALAWLSWPIWLSPWLAGNELLVSILSPSHPLLVIDAAISREGGVPWMEHRLMYAKLTVLGQHVFPSTPTGVGEAALFHGVTGVACFLPVIGVQLWKNRKGRRKSGHDWDEFEAV